jgi:hypothetical protein
MHTEGHDMGKPEAVPAHPAPKHDSEHPGYETQDVNVGGIIVFLAGLAGSVLVFFLFCFVMGKALDSWLVNSDKSNSTKWQADLSQPGATPRGDKRENLKSNDQIQQDQLLAVANAFPAPRMQTDDGNQDTADLHAREDLLLNFNTTSSDLQGGAVRIPIDRAMQLVVQRGLPKIPVATDMQISPSGTKPKQLMAGESVPTVQAPLTDGFARTGYELEYITARDQKNEFEKETKK